MKMAFTNEVKLSFEGKIQLIKVGKIKNFATSYERNRTSCLLLMQAHWIPSNTAGILIFQTRRMDEMSFLICVNLRSEKILFDLFKRLLKLFQHSLANQEGCFAIFKNFKLEVQ